MTTEERLAAIVKYAAQDVMSAPIAMAEERVVEVIRFALQRAYELGVLEGRNDD